MPKPHPWPISAFDQAFRSLYVVELHPNESHAGSFTGTSCRPDSTLQFNGLATGQPIVLVFSLLTIGCLA